MFVAWEFFVIGLAPEERNVLHAAPPELVGDSHPLATNIPSLTGLLELLLKADLTAAIL
jgi:hypothetical protein